ncbi:YhdH/YhfP family quinone oxidoreductase [Bacillus thuringiensis]|uniref:YhdH/YhfP family quinone oxidoreductase n=1 Tax=Bacillus cereus group TaxID=86661 RepID=UPI0010BF07C9|nr:MULTISPECIES: YhdH/YhfP family quinone oxidoreductase [Bacillus cereus group]MCU4885379.1 YhdH/YhfP family quinone oxidoreductase [Bacillus cereus]MDY0947369.1 YhdH/YhfP family quinone oxidoreductase [Bacillus thuringiensis]MDY8160563.1 YhdH/YhfP family quinone oxidoreductase [Bacillus thuringiensis]MEC3157172.1 YhdH/YhfP family quinone oxidoreductase [Bacillus thuringiensis]TKH70856.1 acryloyl-CoA reductase [Bacillus cereus]
MKYSQEEMSKLTYFFYIIKKNLTDKGESIMNYTSFRAIVVNETENHQFVRKVVEREVSSLPEGDVFIQVHYSSLNYKDALSATGNKGVTRTYPHTPGIDAAGEVVRSEDNSFNVGDQVIVTGYDLGMNTSGGFGEYIRVPSSWVVPLPEGMSLKESMMYGTAGFTAALSVYKLIGAGINPGMGDVLVTGATGGVGSVAVSILSKLGFNVVGATGKMEEEQMLLRLGAKKVIHRAELNDESGRPMLKGIYAGVIDTVGGHMLETALKTVKYGGCVTTCGNVAGQELHTTVYPFILRGISLLGIDSGQCPVDVRRDVWTLLADEWENSKLASYTEECTLEELDEKFALILQGKLKGRTVVKIK